MRIRWFHIILLTLFFLSACKEEKKTNWDISFDRNKKDPFGCYIAYHHLSSIFPAAKIKAGRKVMSTIKKTLRGKDGSRSGNVTIVVCQSFEVDSAEMEYLKEYVQNSNGLLVFAEDYSENVYEYFGAKQGDGHFIIHHKTNMDTIPDQELGLLFNDTLHTYHYTGPKVGYGFEEDSIRQDGVVSVGFGTHKDSTYANMHIRYENQGAFLINRAPMALTNYYMLQDSNRQYYEYILSYFNEYPSSVNWFSYLHKEASEESEQDWQDLLRKPALFFAFLILVVTLLLYVLFASKRQQRIIPVVEPLKNSSLDFVETVGRLYYIKKNNKNLAEKMITHYLENIRIRFQLRTQTLDTDLAEKLSIKLEKPTDEIKAFVSYLNYIRGAEQATDIDIQHLYHQLKKYS